MWMWITAFDCHRNDSNSLWKTYTLLQIQQTLWNLSGSCAQRKAQKADCSTLLLKPLIVGFLGWVEIAALIRQVCRKLYYCQCYQNKRKINDAFKQSNCRPQCIMLHNSCNRVLGRTCNGFAVIVKVHIPLSLKGFGPVSVTSIACPTALHKACRREYDTENLWLTCFWIRQMLCWSTVCAMQIFLSVSVCMCYSHPWYSSVKLLHHLLSIQKLCRDSKFMKTLIFTNIKEFSVLLFYNIAICLNNPSVA